MRGIGYLTGSGSTPHAMRSQLSLPGPSALAAELGSTRNAIYKTMFDARRKIRTHLVARGYLREE